MASNPLVKEGGPIGKTLKYRRRTGLGQARPASGIVNLPDLAR